MRILIAYDGFVRSRPALAEAARVAREEDAGRHGASGPAEVIVLSVVPPPESPPGPGGPVSMRPHAHDDVALAHAFLRARGIDSTMRIAYGEPAEEIVKEAAARRSDLIVVGTRGLGPLGRLLLGSVSRRVAELAPCPVAVVSEGHVERLEPAAVPAG